jgi:hypothetical protein
LRTAATAPRNVLICYGDGRTQVRPLRGLRRIPDPPAARPDQEGEPAP